MLDPKTILEELQHLDAQRVQTLQQLHQIEGAIQLARHLLAKAHRPAVGDAARAEHVPENGEVAEKAKAI